jgi:hypothetical protein
MPQVIKAADISEDTLDIVNGLLLGASAFGAYAMGIGTVACVNRGIQPPEGLLQDLREVTSLADAADMIAGFFEAHAVGNIR